ncbi:MAG: MFS transporter [Desulfarculaceae bacterium]|jgi:MFS family permease
MNLEENKTRLTALGGAIFVSMLGVGIIVPFLPLYAKGMGASALMMGMIFSAFAGSRTLMMPFVGILSDRYGRKYFIMLGLAGMAVSALAMLSADTPWQLVGARAGQGLFAAFILPVSMALVADLTPLGHEGRYFGAFNTAMLSGLGLGPLLGGAIHDWLGLEVNFWIMFAMCLTSAIFMAVLVREPPPELRAQGKTGIRQQFTLFKDMPLLGVFLCRMGAAVSLGCFIAFLPVLGAEKGLSAFQVGLLLGLNVLIMTGMQAPSGWLADRFPRLPLAVTGAAVAAAAKGLLPTGDGFWQLSFLVVLEGLAAGVALPSLTALAVGRGRELGMGSGVTMGFFILALSVGVCFGPLLGGLLADFWGISAAFWLAGSVAGLGALTLGFLGVRGAPAPAEVEG